MHSDDPRKRNEPRQPTTSEATPSLTPRVTFISETIPSASQKIWNKNKSLKQIYATLCVRNGRTIVESGTIYGNSELIKQTVAPR